MISTDKPFASRRALALTAGLAAALLALGVASLARAGAPAAAPVAALLLDARAR
jgi:hypothetical protein